MFVSDWTSFPDMAPDSDTAMSPSGVEPEVLVVDDTPAVRELLDAALRADGISVRQAADGREAEEVCRARGSRIGLILMDVQMPMVTGPQALTAIRRFAPAVRCWFMSGDLGGHTEAELFACGAERVLAKPFRIDEVRALVGGHIRPLRACGVTVGAN